MSNEKDKLNLEIKGRTLNIYQSHNGYISESDYESHWGSKEELKLDGSQLWQFDNCNQNGHKKIYANYFLMSNPPQFPWVCEMCGYRGTDRGGKDPYEDLIKMFYNPRD
jgi:hypothetical protein